MFPDVSAAVLPPVQPAGVPGQPHREPPGPGCGGGGDPCPKDCTLGQCGYWGYSSTYLIYFSPYSWDNFFLRVFILYSIFTDSFITGFHGIIKEMSHHMPSNEPPHPQGNLPPLSYQWATTCSKKWATPFPTMIHLHQNESHYLQGNEPHQFHQSDISFLRK